MTNHLSRLFASLWSTISRPGQIDLAEPEKAAPEPITAVQLEAAMRLAYAAGVRVALTEDQQDAIWRAATYLDHDCSQSDATDIARTLRTIVDGKVGE